MLKKNDTKLAASGKIKRAGSEKHRFSSRFWDAPGRSARFHPQLRVNCNRLYKTAACAPNGRLIDLIDEPWMIRSPAARRGAKPLSD